MSSYKNDFYIIYGILIMIGFLLIFCSIPLFINSNKTSIYLIYNCALNMEHIHIIMILCLPLK